jgi:hypothetical protein
LEKTRKTIKVLYFLDAYSIGGVRVFLVTFLRVVNWRNVTLVLLCVGMEKRYRGMNKGITRNLRTSSALR